MITWNVGGLCARLGEPGFISYVCNFDIICLVETFVDTISFLNDVFTGYNCFCAPAHQIGLGRKSGGVVVLIKKHLSVHFMHIDTQLPNIVCCKFSKKLLNTLSDVVIIFTYVHPQNSKWYQQAEINCDIITVDTCVSNMMQEYKDVHFIVCGDLNSRVGDANPYLSDVEPDSRPWENNTIETGPQRQSEDKTPNQFGSYLLTFCEIFDLAILNGFCNGDREGKFTYISPTGSSVIDYFLCSHELLQLNLHLTVGQEILSQHLPVELNISSKPGPVQTPGQARQKQTTKIVWQEDKRTLLMEAAESDEAVSLLNQARTSLNSVNLNNAIEAFTCYLSRVSQCMTRVIRPFDSYKDPSWFDNDCRLKKTGARGALREYRKAKTDLNRLVYCHYRKEYKELLKEKKECFKKRQVNALVDSSGDGLQFWSTVRTMLRKSQPKANISLDQWQEHFETLLNANDENQSDQEDIIINAEPTDYCHITDRPIVSEEIKDAIGHLKRNKASGWDGIPAEVIKTINVMPFLHDYLNALLETGYFPEFWSKSIIVPIFKKGDTDDPGNYRGVSLVSVVSKIFTHILNKRLTQWMEETEQIVEEQAGFRAGYSTVDHIFSLYTIIQKSLAQNKKVFVAFIDYRRAFDSINRNKLWACLCRKGLSRKMLKILKSMYENVLCCVRAGQDYTEFFGSPIGLKQGCLLSPKIFALFVNEVAEELKRDGRHGITLSNLIEEIFALLFADDLALVSHTVVGLQNQLNVLARASGRLGLSVNLSKTKVMVFRKGGYLAAREKWYLNGDLLEVVNSYTYLGFTLTTKLSICTAMEQIAARAKKKVMDILRALWRIECNDIKVFLRLFDLQVQPALLYASEIWGVKEIAEIERVQMYACKKLLSVSQKTPNTMIYGELGRHPLFINSLMKAIKYWLKLLEMPSHRIPRAIYDHLKRLEERGIKTWASDIKNHVFRLGFGYSWIEQQVGNKTGFLKMLKQRLLDCFQQDWHAKLFDSERFVTYRSFKTILQYEHYLSSLHIRRYRDVLVRFRVGINDLYCNRHRYNVNRRLELCPLCGLAEEDEIHFIFACQAYSNIRQQFSLNILFNNCLRARNFVNLMNIENQEMLASFIFDCLKLRQELIANPEQ